tara:strand:+ start:372 stop:1097 length:726 start_codon:yes stop_codon:yes gene_type:complete
MNNFKIFKYANPAKFLALCEKTFVYLVALMVVSLSFGLYQGFFNSPEDYQQGNLVRIMYVHVPSAWMALMIYSSIAFASCLYLINKHLLANIFCKSASLIGASFTLIALVTGSIWGKPTWGTWWVWDARITSMLVLFFLYLGHMTIFNFSENTTKSGQSAALLAILGFVNIPIIKFSVDWWNTLHQPASVLKLSGPTIHSSMLVPLLITALGFFFYFLVVLTIRMRSEITNEKINNMSFTK